MIAVEHIKCPRSINYYFIIIHRLNNILMQRYEIKYNLQFTIYNYFVTLQQNHQYYGNGR